MAFQYQEYACSFLKSYVHLKKKNKYTLRRDYFIIFANYLCTGL